MFELVELWNIAYQNIFHVNSNNKLAFVGKGFMVDNNSSPIRSCKHFCASVAKHLLALDSFTLLDHSPLPKAQTKMKTCMGFTVLQDGQSTLKILSESLQPMSIYIQLKLQLPFKVIECYFCQPIYKCG